MVDHNLKALVVSNPIISAEYIGIKYFNMLCMLKLFAYIYVAHTHTWFGLFFYSWEGTGVCITFLKKPVHSTVKVTTPGLKSSGKIDPDPRPVPNLSDFPQIRVAITYSSTFGYVDHVLMKLLPALLLL